MVSLIITCTQLYNPFYWETLKNHGWKCIILKKKIFFSFFQKKFCIMHNLFFLRADKTEISVEFSNCVFLFLFSFLFSFSVSANRISLKLKYFCFFSVKQSSSDRSDTHFRPRKQTTAVGSYGFVFRITHGSFTLGKFVQIVQSPVYTLSSFHDVEEVIQTSPFFGGSLCNRAHDSSGPLGCHC